MNNPKLKAKMLLIQENVGDVLSGKPTANPTVRGAFGEACIMRVGREEAMTRIAK